MSLYKLSGTPTLGGPFRWDTTYTCEEWRIQHHKTEFLKFGLMHYRLLDPEDHLMASADTEKELKEYLFNLLKH